MTASDSRRRRNRRRVVRLSDAANYDRTADTPDFQSSFDDDGERRVSFDTDPGGVTEEVEALHNDGPRGEAAVREAFYREQQPPHYGE